MKVALFSFVSLATISFAYSLQLGGIKLPIFAPPSSTPTAQKVIQALNEKGFNTRDFLDACADDIRYEDLYEKQPILGKGDLEKYLQQRQYTLRADFITDGTKACGFAWTWTDNDQEGLRGTTFVRLNQKGKVDFVQEIPEPIYKPGDATKELLQAVTKGAQPKTPQPFQKRSPSKACDIAKYLYVDLQNAGAKDSMSELLRFLDDDIIYRDFNYEEPLRGPQQVKDFVEDFSFPGIEFRPTCFDDGKDSTCFTWEVVLEGIQQTVRGMSIYQLDPKSRKVVYVRDVPESPFKPPPLGSLARLLRPSLGSFQPKPAGSRDWR